jgi:hypothetical protein
MRRMGVGGRVHKRKDVKNLFETLKKRILLVIAITVISSLLPFRGFAYNSGYFDSSISSYTLSGITQENFNRIIDNDETTAYSLTPSESFSIVFSNPIDFEGVSIISGGLIMLTFYDSSNVAIFSDVVGSTDFSTKSASGVKKIVIKNNSSTWSQGVAEFDLMIDSDTTPPDIPTGLTAIGGDGFATLSWNANTESDLQGYDVYQSMDNVIFTKVDFVPVSSTSVTINNLTNGVTYYFAVTAVDTSGNESERSPSVSVTLIPPPEEVTDLEADTEYDRVKLSWTRPESEFFSHVNIYRKVVEDESFFDRLFGVTAVSAETTSDGYTPMFETNGTYWTDLTVEPETTYSYRVTSENIEGRESDGVTIEATTPSEPIPTMEGVEVEQDEHGDYVFSWTSPTTGQIRVLVGGTEYQTVDASLGQITIPANDMRLNAFGEPDVELVPIGRFGTVGDSVDVGDPSFDLPFNATDLLETGMGLLFVIGPFLLLALSFLVVPRLRVIIIETVKKRKERSV